MGMWQVRYTGDLAGIAYWGLASTVYWGYGKVYGDLEDTVYWGSCRYGILKIWQVYWGSGRYGILGIWKVQYIWELAMYTGDLAGTVFCLFNMIVQSAFSRLAFSY